MTSIPDRTPDHPSATCEVLADPDRVQHLDPRDLLVDANSRETTLDRAFVASIREHGNLQEIRAVATGDGRVRVLFGHRRVLAAIEAGQETVRVIVHPDGGETEAREAEAARLVGQFHENHHRRGYSDAEELALFDDLAQAGGLSAGKVAGRLKAPRKRVAAALAAAAVPEAREAVETAGLTLEQGAALAEFADYAPWYEQLLDHALNPDPWRPFDHIVAALRAERAQDEALEKLEADQRAAGVPVVDATTLFLYLDDLGIDPEAHTSCPGHAAYIGDADEGFQAWPVCTQPDQHPTATNTATNDHEHGVDGDGEPVGPTSITPSFSDEQPGGSVPAWRRDESEASRRMRERCAEADREWQEYRRADREREAQLQREAEEAGRRRVRQGRLAWSAATEVRRTFARELLQRGRAPKGAARYTAATTVADAAVLQHGVQQGGHDRAAIMLTGTRGAITASGRTRLLELLDAASEPRSGVIALGVVVGALEDHHELENLWRRGEHESRAVDGLAELVAAFTRYTDFLTGAGYQLAPIERLALGQTLTEHLTAELFPTQPEHTDDPGDTTAPGAAAGGGWAGDGVETIDTAALAAACRTAAQHADERDADDQARFGTTLRARTFRDEAVRLRALADWLDQRPDGTVPTDRAAWPCTTCDAGIGTPCGTHDRGGFDVEGGEPFVHTGRGWAHADLPAWSGTSNSDSTGDGDGEVSPCRPSAEGGPAGTHRGRCRDCGWRGPVRDTEAAAVEDAHDHTHPGWRAVPSVDPAPHTENPRDKKLARWEQTVTDTVTAVMGPDWLQRGGPIRTRRGHHATRHVPGRAPGGGYDLAADIT